MTPSPVFLASSFPGRRNVLLVERLRDSLERNTVCGHLENTSDDGRFRFIDRQPNLAIIRLHNILSEATASSVLPIQGLSF